MNYKYVAPEKFGVDCEMRDDWGDAFIQALANLDVPTTLGHHSENVEITSARGDNPYLDADVDEDQAYRGYDQLVEQFPGYAEAQSMTASGSLARQHGYDDSFYAVHISSGRTADELAMLQNAGWEITGETCTHYLCLTTEECDERHNVNPPVRSKADQETLWRRVADGTISCIGTDHCANLAEDKIGQDVVDSLPGFPSTATMLPLVLSEGVNENRISLERAVEVTSTNTAKAFDLYPKKGTIRVGSDADLAVVDLDETKTVTPELLRSAADYSPYEGRAVTGWPTHTVVKGELAYEHGDVVGTSGHGTHVDRPI
jgi:dihydropyrimidinase